ncbi:MAG: HlyD family efflux transporter periplasmic adaptor subunit [Chloroflexi bacterium]|nr:HlyD family efflux transporter periplasmic adaptor subunit [Chloroflexota bacterium]
MKKIIPIILVIGLVSLPLLSCASKAGAAPKTQTATVQRGDLTADITGVGNLALSHKVDLAFGMDGTVAEVLVEEGESVTEGQLLAKLDTSAWEDYITGLEDKMTAAERNLTAKERAVPTAERQVVVKKLDQLQAQVNLQTTEDSLTKIGVVGDAQKAVDDAQYNLSIAQAMFQQASLSTMSADAANFWATQVNNAQKNLTDANKELKEVLAGSSVKVTTDVATQLAINQLQVEIARGRLEDAKTAIGDAQKAVEDAKLAAADARKAWDEAKKTLDEAKSTSPEVTASFAGFITKVNVKGGDIVKKGAVAVTLADPTKFEADVMVSEANIPKVKVTGTASVQVEAMPGVSLAANVTHIAPTATIQSGVVNYKVTVEIQSPQSTASRPLPATGNVTSGNASPTASLGRAGQMFGSGNLTQGQLDQMRQQRQPATGNATFGGRSVTGNVTSGSTPSGRQPATGNITSGNSFSSRQQRPTPTTISGDFQLKEGMTVTVTIILQQKSDVLLIPNAAITTKGGQTYVQVPTTNGSTEQRLIRAGISNLQYTEITSGLSEGEQVTVPQNTAATPRTQQTGGAGGIRMPTGIGGFGR